MALAKIIAKSADGALKSIKMAAKDAGLNPEEAYIDAEGVVRYPEQWITPLSERGYGDVRRVVASHNENVLGDDYRKSFKRGYHGTDRRIEEEFNPYETGTWSSMDTSGNVSITDNADLAAGYADTDEKRISIAPAKNHSELKEKRIDAEQSWLKRLKEVYIENNMEFGKDILPPDAMKSDDILIGLSKDLDDARLAEQMAAGGTGTEGANVMPVLYRGDKIKQVDSWGESFDPQKKMDYNIDAEKGGYDVLELEGYEDDTTYKGLATEPQTGVTVFNPANIRSEYAALDPQFKKSRNLLASSSAAAPLMGAALMGQSQDAEAGMWGIPVKRLKNKKYLYHSGTADRAEKIHSGIEPRHGEWVQETLAGAVDDPDMYTEGMPLAAWYSENPDWVRIKVAKKLGKNYTDVSMDDIREYGHVSIIDPEGEWHDPEDFWRMPDEMVDGEYTDVVNLAGEQEKLYATPLYEHNELGGMSYPHGLEPGDIVSTEVIEPVTTLTGQDLIDFLRKTQPDQLPNEAVEAAAKKLGVSKKDVLSMAGTAIPLLSNRTEAKEPSRDEKLANMLANDPDTAWMFDEFINDIKQNSRNMAGRGEAALTFASGIPAYFAGALASAPVAFSGDADETRMIQEDIADRWTYMPRMQEGQKALMGAAEFIEPAMPYIEAAPEAVFEYLDFLPPAPRAAAAATTYAALDTPVIGDALMGIGAGYKGLGELYEEAAPGMLDFAEWAF